MDIPEKVMRAAAELAVGELGDIVTSDIGVHIHQAHGRMPPTPETKKAFCPKKIQKRAELEIPNFHDQILV